MRLSNLLLTVILACSIVPPALADNPCSSIATSEPSQKTRKFQNRELSFEIPANFRIIATNLGLMIHSPWSYEVYICQLNSKYPGSYTEKAILLQVMSYSQASEFIQDIYSSDLYSEPISTVYPWTTAKMYVTAGSENASGFVPFVKNKRMVVI